MRFQTVISVLFGTLCLASAENTTGIVGAITFQTATVNGKTSPGSSFSIQDNKTFEQPSQVLTANSFCSTDEPNPGTSPFYTHSVTILQPVTVTFGSARTENTLQLAVRYGRKTFVSATASIGWSEPEVYIGPGNYLSNATGNYAYGQAQLGEGNPRTAVITGEFGETAMYGRSDSDPFSPALTVHANKIITAKLTKQPGGLVYTGVLEIKMSELTTKASTTFSSMAAPMQINQGGGYAEERFFRISAHVS